MIHNAKPSSLVQQVRYDPLTREMQIDLTNGNSYAYSGVDSSDHNALVSSESHGKHFNTVFLPKYKSAGRKL